ncbi:MAG: primosomal protein N' [Candidatus Magasanikbacteria bacterium]
MIAQVAPLRRMPSDLNLFDYETKEIEQEVKAGQLVKIPFKGSEIFGITFNLKQKSDVEFDLKSISSIVHSTPFFSKQRLNLFQEVSQIYNISCATQTKISFLPIQKRKLKQLELKSTPYLNQFESTHPEQDSNSETDNNKQDKTSLTNTTKENPPKFKLYQTQDEHKEIFENASKPSLVLLPQLQYIEEIEKYLDLKDENLITWHSKLSQKEQFKRWLQVRNKEVSYVIGTRSAVFLPFQQLDEIIVDLEHKENHKHWDQDPRFHSLDIAKKLKTMHSANLTLSSFSPSCRSYFNIYKENYDYNDGTKDKIQNIADKTTEIINMKQERKAGNYDIFSEKAKKNIKSAEEDVFIFINRLGYSRSVRCNECGFTAECPQCGLTFVYHKQDNELKCHYCDITQKSFAACPECEQQIVEHQGAGDELIEEKTKEITPDKEIIRINKRTAQSPIPEKEENKIIIGTEKALEYINWSNTEVIVFPNIDSQLSFPEFMVSENVWNLIQEINHYRTQSSEFYIQSMNPDQLVLKSIKEPDRFYRMELNSRKNLNYPPYKFLVRLFYGSKQQQKTKKEVEKIYSKLSEKLTENYKTNIIISRPTEMHPKFYRSKYWQTILLKLPKDNWEKELKWINEFIDKDWKVDPRPISVLSP